MSGVRTVGQATLAARQTGDPGEDGVQLIRPCIWFGGKAEEAAAVYTGLFPESRIVEVSRYPEEGQEIHGQPPEQAMVVEMELAGHRLSALNGGPAFKITPAISLFVQVGTEREVDALWEGLAADGSVLMPLDRYEWSDRYGWLVDRFGLTWQIALDPGRAAPDIALSLLFTGAQHSSAEPALNFYTSVFPESRVEGILRHDGSGGEVTGTVKHAQFSLHGQTFMVMESALDHQFGFTEAVSFIVQCRTQEEVDAYWSALLAGGGTESMCGWLKDRFGVSWQIVPEAVGRLMASSDKAAAGRTMRALLGMRKLDIAALEAAHAGRTEDLINWEGETVMSYVDGFVAAVPTANREKFRKHAEDAAAVFKEHGALKVVECWGDDVPDGKLTSFPTAVQRKEDETVVFSWIVWPSREARNAGMEMVMADPRMQPEANPMPFDGKRVIYGGFETIVER